MRYLSFVCLAFVLAICSLAPSTGHAASVKPFVSTECPYSIVYPSAWHEKSAKGSDDFIMPGSHHTDVYVTCAQTNVKTIKQITTQLVSTLKKQGFTFPGKTKYISEAGQKASIIAGTRILTAGNQKLTLVAELTTILAKGHAYEFILSGDKTGFSTALSSYANMLNSFRPR